MKSIEKRYKVTGQHLGDVLEIQRLHVLSRLGNNAQNSSAVLNSQSFRVMNDLAPRLFLSLQTQIDKKTWMT